MQKPTKGVIVDGSTRGNPGPSKYRVYDLEKKSIIYETDWIGITTNNVTEFLAVCHAIYLVNKANLNLPIYSDSVTAISWVNKKLVTSNCKNLEDRIKKACTFLKETDMKNIVLEKWHTSTWGENPADFGNK